MEVQQASDLNVLKTNVDFRGVQMVITTTQPQSEPLEELKKRHEWALKNTDVVYFQSLQMHKDIAARRNCTQGDWPEEMKERSRKWLTKYGTAWKVTTNFYSG